MDYSYFAGDLFIRGERWSGRGMCAPRTSGLSAQTGGGCGRCDRGRAGGMDQREWRLDWVESVRAASDCRIHSPRMDRHCFGGIIGDVFVDIPVEIHRIPCHS